MELVRLMLVLSFPAVGGGTHYYGFYLTFLLGWRKRSSSNNEGLVKKKKKSRQRGQRSESEEVAERLTRWSDMILFYKNITLVLICLQRNL